MKSFFFYLLPSILCLLFALNAYNKMVCRTSSPYILKCEGIVLDKQLNYHITDKDNISALRKNRENRVEINSGDILLHYRDADVNLCTPSYWGSLFYHDKQWNFRLDESFSDNSDSPHLPFLRFKKKENFDFRYVKPTDTISEEQLRKGLIFNNSFGTKRMRFNLNLRTINSKTVLPWFDDGIKRTYALKAKNDTILISFNDNKILPRFYTYHFDNTTNNNGAYELIYTPNDKTVVLQCRNIYTGKIFEIDDEYFQIENMMFSILRRFSLIDQFYLLVYIGLCIFTIIFILGKLWIENNYAMNKFYGLSASIVCFMLLGLPILIIAFDGPFYDNSWLRKTLLILVPFIIPASLISYHVVNRPNWLKSQFESIIKKLREDQRGNFLLLKANKIIERLKTTRIWIWQSLMFLVLMIILWGGTTNERVLSIIPVLHYVKILILFFFIATYTKSFSRFSDKSLNLVNRYFTWRRLTTFFRNDEIGTHRFTIVCIAVFSILISIISHDMGSGLFVILTLLFREVFIYGGKYVLNEDQSLLAFGLKAFGTYVFIILAIFFLSGISNNPKRSFNRLTYTLANPSDNEYQFTHEGDRESYAYQYQALNYVLNINQDGLTNIHIPSHMQSVAHTDYAILWSLICGGKYFLFLLLFVMLYFLYNVYQISRLLLFKNSIFQAKEPIREFLAFSLIMLSFQAIIPLTANLMLPATFFTGVPFPSISISLGDSFFLFILLYLLLRIAKRSSDDGSYTVAINKAKKTSLKLSFFIIISLIFWIGLRVFMFSYQDNTQCRWNKKIKKQVPIPEKKVDQIKLINSLKDSNIKPNERSRVGKALLCSYYGNNLNDLQSDSRKFKLTQADFARIISADSIRNLGRQRISGEKWNGKKPAYVQYYYENRVKKRLVSHDAFSMLDFDNKSFNVDASANINIKLEKYIAKITRNFPACKKINASVLVTHNTSGEILVNSQFPYKEDLEGFYPASIKKIILALYCATEQPKLLNCNNYPLDNSEFGTAHDWIAMSKNEASRFVWDNIKQDKFAYYIHHKLNLHYNSGVENSYLGKNWNPVDSALVSRTIIGAEVKYAPFTINRWMQVVANECFEHNNKALRGLMKQPLIHKRATAARVSTELKRKGYKPDDFIAKTGTLSVKGRNIATAFAIANEKYTVTVLLNGRQPNNKAELSAKDFFITIIPELSDFLKCSNN